MTIDYQAIEALIDHTVEATLKSPVSPSLLKEGCERLSNAGVSVLRVNMSWGTLHPTIVALSLKWWKDQPFDDVIRYGHSDTPSDEWAQSPGYYLLQNSLKNLEISLEKEKFDYDFPLLSELKEAGGTEYVINLIPFSADNETFHEDDGVLLSWLSDRPGGFSNEEHRIINRVQKHIALALKVAVRERITLNTLTAYLGENAAHRVLRGTIKLGDGEMIPAVIWYSDLRQSTDLGDCLPGPELLSTLNEYFACTAGAVMDHGGEVLRFIGDAVLAIFPSKNADMTEACKQATKAALEARKRMAQTNEKRQNEGKRTLEFGLGLHVGELMFGNIGVPERLDFAVTGPAANEAARIETLTKELGRSTLASKQFVEHTPEAWETIGQHPLRGVGQPIELFSLRREWD